MTARNATLNGNGVVHVRFNGRSFDVPIDALELGVAASDVQVKRSLAAALQVNEGQFRGYVVDRHENGNLTVRPEAVFG